jgi:histidinol-phosphate aminotransferase
LKQGVVVRPLKAFGLPHCFRVSTGTDEENQIFAEAMRKICMKEEVCKS